MGSGSDLPTHTGLKPTEKVQKPTIIGIGAFWAVFACFPWFWPFLPQSSG
jgi:hypothetical protein